MLERLPAPAPFVFGGSFSDYLKGDSKFRRFSTLASLAKAAKHGDDGAPEREAEIQDLYAAARREDIGTVDHIETPEGAVNIVNLVDIARFIERSTMPGTCLGDEDMEVADEDDVSDEEDVSGDEEMDVEEVESVKECALIHSADAFLAKEVTAAKSIPRVEPPIVYSGTFQEYKNDESKFHRFTTLARFKNAACVNQVEGSTSLCDETIQRDEMDQVVADWPRRTIIECPVRSGYVPFQLLALAAPPGMQDAGSVFATMSDAFVQEKIGSTMAGAKATAKIAAALGTTMPPRMRSACASACDIKELSVISDAPKAPFTESLAVSPYRFRFGDYDLNDFGTRGFMPAVEPLSQKINIARKAKDDGSTWIVGHSFAAGSEMCGDAKFKPGSKVHSSGSSWGGGGTLLEPICQGKVSLSQPVKVTLPNFPVSSTSMLSEASHEASWNRLTIGKERPLLG
jgi:hypothetical protein